MVGITQTMQAAARVVRAAAADPIEVWTKVQDELMDQWEHRKGRADGQAPHLGQLYEPTHEWERRLHEILEVSWPCEATSEFWELWPRILEPLRATGLAIGRGAFGGWGDGETGLTRAAWCLTRHLRPSNVVETGVARGFTTRVVLEALERNGIGHLWSIDLPPQLKPELQQQIGLAVGNQCRHRWTYIRGSSRRQLPGLISRLGRIDLFIHDSRHSERNVLFELSRVSPALTSGGAMVVDDIDLNRGFQSFTMMASGYQSLTCFAEPLEADPTRADSKGLFGILRKGPDGQPQAR
jgi:Methyltransferase domain